MGVLGSSAFQQNRRTRFVCGSNNTLARARNLTAIMSSTGSTLLVAVISFAWLYFAWTFTTTFFLDIYCVSQKWVAEKYMMDDSLPWLVSRGLLVY